MAHLTRQQYDRRRENAAQRAIDNEQAAQQNGMTAEQAELISRLSSLRHELHTNTDHVVKSDEKRIKMSILYVNADIEESGLDPMDFVSSSKDDYIDIDTIEEMYEWDEVPEPGTDEWQEWYDDNYQRIYDELETLNKNIEAYLAEIDNKYNTSYCPTGALRIF